MDQVILLLQIATTTDRVVNDFTLRGLLGKQGVNCLSSSQTRHAGTNLRPKRISGS